MALDYELMMSMPPLETRSRYSRHDVILYALGLGIGMDDPTASETLRYTYEAGLEVFPTMVVTIGYPGFWLRDPRFGLDWTRILHGEQAVELHRPLPVEADVVSRLKIDDIYDKGAAKGALLLATREIFDASSGDKLATLRSASFLRGDGGFGVQTGAAPTAHQIPEDRDPDLSINVRSRVDQALIYRLSGDDNPLHIDPSVARKAGYDRPILHGLCTYGIVARVLVTHLCRGVGGAFQSFAARFSSPVFPGETLRVAIWRQSAGFASVRANVLERGVRVIDHGVCRYSETPLR